TTASAASAHAQSSTGSSASQSPSVDDPGSGPGCFSDGPPSGSILAGLPWPGSVSDPQPANSAARPTIAHPGSMKEALAILGVALATDGRIGIDWHMGTPNGQWLHAEPAMDAGCGHKVLENTRF